MSSPVVASRPSKPGEELTSRILGPVRASSMSTPATSRPITRVALTAASAYSRGRSSGSASPPRWMLERKSPARARRRDDAIADHQRAHVLAARLLHQLLEEDLLAEGPERVEHPLHLGHGVGD